MTFGNDFHAEIMIPWVVLKSENMDGSPFTTLLCR
jgi:hypothetical protein